SAAGSSVPNRYVIQIHGSTKKTTNGRAIYVLPCALRLDAEVESQNRKRGSALPAAKVSVTTHVAEKLFVGGEIAMHRASGRVCKPSFEIEYPRTHTHLRRNHDTSGEGRVQRHAPARSGRDVLGEHLAL